MGMKSLQAACARCASPRAVCIGTKPIAKSFGAGMCKLPRFFITVFFLRDLHVREKLLAPCGGIQRWCNGFWCTLNFLSGLLSE